MSKYFVELDGVSIINSNRKLLKDDIIVIADGLEKEFYRISDNSSEELSLRRLKTITNTHEATKNIYTLDGKTYYFENRLSKNQTINIFGVLFKVLDIEKGFNELRVETIKFKSANSMYGVYVSRSDEGLTIRDREKNGYVAEKYFSDRFDAIGYAMQEIRKGRKVSL